MGRSQERALLGKVSAVLSGDALAQRYCPWGGQQSEWLFGWGPTVVGMGSKTKRRDEYPSRGRQVCLHRLWSVLRRQRR